MSRKSIIRDDFEETKLRLETLKENFEYQDFFKRFLSWYEDQKPTEKIIVWPVLGFKKFGLGRMRYYIGHPNFKTSDLIDLLNPDKDTDRHLIKPIRDFLPKMFYENSVSLVELNDARTQELPTDGCGNMVTVHGLEKMAPGERLFKVDMTKRKRQILSEFRKYITAAFSNSNLAEDLRRQRQETSIQLKIWKMRRQKLSFREISRTLKTTIDTAKKGFYRAYEITQNKKYDEEGFKKKMRVKKSDMKNLCETCSQKPNCEVLCPDALRFVNQDYVKTDYHEKLLP